MAPRIIKSVYIRPVKAQSVQFSKITKKLNIDLCQFFYEKKVALFLSKSWKKTRFFARAACAESAHHMHFLRFWERNGMYVEWHVCGRGKKALKIHFYRIYIEISQLGRNESQSELAQVQHPLSRFSVKKSNSATHVLLTLCTFPTHWVSSRQERTATENSKSVYL